MLAAGAFFSAIVLGYFVLPPLFKKEQLYFFLDHATSLEADWRDWVLKPLTDRLKFVAPNFVTGAGFFLILVLAYLFWAAASWKVIFWTVLLAGFTDQLDGSLARNNGRVTKIGAVLDWSRDLLLAAVAGYFLLRGGFLSADFVRWFFVGWASLGLVRIFELGVFAERSFLFEKDYKFMLDRLRLFLAWVGVLFLLLVYYNAFLGKAGNFLLAASIVFSWVSLVFHSAHLKILRGEKTGL